MAARKHNLFHYLFVIFENLVKGIVSSLLWFLLALVGYLIFKKQGSPVGIIIGLPIILAAAGLIINDLATVFQAIFSPPYNRGVCKLCGK